MRKLVSAFIKCWTLHANLNSKYYLFNRSIVLESTKEFFLQDQSFTSFNLDEHTSTVLDVEKLWDSNPELSLALTSYHARDPSYFFMLNKLSCAVSLLLKMNR